MKLVEINGTIESLGPSQVDGHGRQYDYISFVGPGGAATHVRKVKASNTVDAAVYAGAEGVFFVFKLLWQRHLIACKVGDRVACDELIDWPLWRVYLYYVLGFALMLGLAGVGALLSFIIIGLPVLFVALAAMAAMIVTAPMVPGWRRRVRAALGRHGVVHRRVVEV